MKLHEGLGLRIKSVRRAQNLSQRRLAEVVNDLGGFPTGAVHHTTVQKIERGERRVAVDEWLILSRALGVAPGLLLVLPEPVEVPGVGLVDPWELFAWVAGFEPLYDEDYAGWRRQAGPIELYRAMRPLIERAGFLLSASAIGGEPDQAELRRLVVEILRGLRELEGLDVPTGGAVPRYLEDHLASVDAEVDWPLVERHGQEHDR